ncbi:hypothetical protein SVIOM342S_05115 [Streptomyces violaceorubidus]
MACQKGFCVWCMGRRSRPGFLAPVPAAAEPGPGPAEGPAEGRTVAELLTDLQRLYREAERATETYNGTEERLKEQRARVLRLNAELTRTRLSLRDSRGAAGRLARQQYQSSSNLSPYLRLLLARDPQHALDQGHVIGRLSKERAETVGRLTGDTKRADELAGGPGWRWPGRPPSPSARRRNGTGCANACAPSRNCSPRSPRSSWPRWRSWRRAGSTRSRSGCWRPARSATTPSRPPGARALCASRW